MIELEAGKGEYFDYVTPGVRAIDLRCMLLVSSEDGDYYDPYHTYGYLYFKEPVNYAELSAEFAAYKGISISKHSDFDKGEVRFSDYDYRTPEAFVKWAIEVKGAVQIYPQELCIHT